jgi:hypothetical protein
MPMAGAMYFCNQCLGTSCSGLHKRCAKSWTCTYALVLCTGGDVAYRCVSYSKACSVSSNTMVSADFSVGNAFLPYNEKQTDMWIKLFIEDTELWEDKVDGKGLSDPNMCPAVLS